MAFSFANSASGGTDSVTQTANIREGPELQEIQTNELGFTALNGESKIQLLPTPWPSNDLPPPSSSLLSVASVRGLLAAAGPDALYIASTKGIRTAFQSPPQNNLTTRAFTPEIKLPTPRLHHVAFSADESVLVVSPASGGLLAYQVEHLQKGQLDPAGQISTNGRSLRALIPNPVPESAEIYALITADGELMLLDLKAAAEVAGSGRVLQQNATCVSWSNKGKQLVAGKSDGTLVQMKPDGTIVAEIPTPTTITSPSHVSGVSWLKDDTFFIIYTPNSTSDGTLPSDYYIVEREPKTTNYVFQKLPEVVPAFGMERLPSFHFITRLRNFSHIQDLLILSATTATDVALVSKSNKPLSQEDQVTSAFTLTAIEDDTRRAQLPLSSDAQDTSPIGMVIDLSSTETVPNPIPADSEILETVGPVPCLTILNNEGVLAAWWVIYNDSVREKSTFPGFTSVQAARDSPTEAPSAGPTPSSSSFNSFAKSAATPAFGATGTQSIFATESAKPFGTSSPIAAEKPSWATTGFGASNNAGSAGPSFGSPAFGSATPMGSNSAPAFGSATMIGGPKAPAFGSASALGSRPSAFGQPSSFNSSSMANQPSPFATPAASSPFATAGNGPSSSGFASFSNTGGFSSFAAGKAGQNNPSPFAATNASSVFGQPPQSTFGSGKPQGSPFAATNPTESRTLFGDASSFKVQSSFQSDGTAKDDLPKPKEPVGFDFGSTFGDALGDARKPLSPTHDQEAEMDEESDGSEAESDKVENRQSHGFLSQSSNQPPQTLITPPSTLTQSKATPAPPVSGLFSQGNKDDTPPQPQHTTPAWSFNALPSTTPKETPSASHMALFGPKPTPRDSTSAVQDKEPSAIFDPIQAPPHIKKEPPSDEESVDLQSVPEAPLPPDPVSKPRYAETSASSNQSKTPSDDAHLAPEFLPVPKAGQDLPAEAEDDFSSDFAESGEDLDDDGSQEGDTADEQLEQLQTSPESSFKSGDRSPEVSPTGGLFTKVSSNATAPKPTRPLFGEVGSGPVFAPPKPHESPRSPSPVRNILKADGLRADPSRSVSAPARPRSIIEQRKAEYQQSGLAAQAAKMREEEAAKEQARREALARERADAEAQQLAPLEDDEDERLRQELERPISPAQSLDEFVTYQSKPPDVASRPGIPGQIERLYSDINAMVYTLGINCRSLSAFMQYQQPDAVNQSWPAVLGSETPLDALNDELLLADIARLHEGHLALSTMLSENNLNDFNGTLQQAQMLMNQDLFELRTRIISLRKTLQTLSSTNTAITTPLAAEQSSIQHDLRKAFASVQTKMVQIEDGVSVLRARLAQSAPAEGSRGLSSALGRVPSQKKPTVEAVTKTVGKMMAMAERKSADIDVLEAQLRKLDLSIPPSVMSNGNSVGDHQNFVTPQRNRRSMNGATPGSSGSIYHTPDSKFGSSTRSFRGFQVSQQGGLALLSAEDKERWQGQARRRKQVARLLKEVLDAKRTRTPSKR